MLQISCTYYSEVANSGSSAIPGHSYDFHVKLFKMKQTKLYTLITVYGPFCIWSVNNIWRQTFTEHPRNKIRNQALLRSRFSLIFDMLLLLFTLQCGWCESCDRILNNSCVILHMHSVIRQKLFIIISAQLNLHLLINQTEGVSPIAGQFSWNTFLVVLR